MPPELETFVQCDVAAILSGRRKRFFSRNQEEKEKKPVSLRWDKAVVEQ